MWCKDRVSRRSLVSAGVLCCALIGASLAIAAAHNTVSISGTTSIKRGNIARFLVKGVVVSPANKVAVFTDKQACATKELAELRRAASVEIDQGFLGNAMGVKFKWHEARALGLGTHYLCAYVFKRASISNDPHTTYAHAQHKWTVHT